MKDCSEELTTKFLGKISLHSKCSLKTQLKLRKILESILIDYDVVPREKSLVKSDVIEKATLFIANKKFDGLSNTTLKNYSYILNKFADTVIKPVSIIETRDIRYFLFQHYKNAKPLTYNAIVNCLRSFFQWLVIEEYLIINPMLKIKTMKEQKKLREALTVSEMEILRNSCKTLRQRALIEVLYSTGCRVSEISQMNISKINYDGTLSIIGKGNKERVVFINEKAMLHLKNYLD